MAQFPTRTSPFAMFDRDFLDDAFEGFFRPMRSPVRQGPTNMAPALDVSERADHYSVQAELPGCNKEDIHVSVENDRLVIEAEHSEERREGEQESQRAVIRERRCGKFMRSLQLGPEVRPEDIEASYDNGVLELRVPKAQSRPSQAQRIEVH